MPWHATFSRKRQFKMKNEKGKTKDRRRGSHFVCFFFFFLLHFELELLTKRPRQFAVTDENATQHHESLVDIVATLVAHTETAKLVEPGQTAFNYVADLSQAAAVSRAALRYERVDIPRQQGQSPGSAVIGPICKQRPRPATGTPRLARHRRHLVNQGDQLCNVVSVRSGERARQRDALSVGEQVMLAAGFAAVRRIRPGLGPPKTARTDALSMTARFQSIWSALFSKFNRQRCNSSQTPAFCHSRSRRQQVIPLPHPISCGRYSQPMPVRSTNSMPVRALRSSIRLRPGYRKRRFFGLGRRGSMSIHNPSSRIGLAMTTASVHVLHARNHRPASRSIFYAVNTKHADCSF